MSVQLQVGPFCRRAGAAIGLAVIACTSCAAPRPETESHAEPTAEAATADPARLLTSPPGSVILQARIFSVLRVENGCLVIGATEPRTVLWPAGTTLSFDRRAVIVPGARRPIAIGERLLASGGEVNLDTPPSGAPAVAIAHGCPGSLVAVGEVLVEE